MTTTSLILTPLGDMSATFVDDQLTMLEFVDESTLLVSSRPVVKKLQTQINEYFAGKRTTFEIEIQPAGTPFQQLAWRSLCAIPFGQTRSYNVQAVTIGKASAVRAVARANAQNPIAILIPCHRVIGADGSLTGYAGGLWRKRALLELEGAIEQDLPLFATPTESKI